MKTTISATIRGLTTSVSANSSMRKPMTRMRAIRCMVFEVVALIGGTELVSGATITQIFGPESFISATTIANNFEGGVVNTPPANTSEFTFENTALLADAKSWNDNGTSSGSQGLVESAENEPMRIFFTTPVSEVGLFFGNDDFSLKFNANLELFDAGNNSLGRVQVACNANDAADQYLGARSDFAVASIAISYDRPAAQHLSVYIDDLMVGLIPEPSSVALLFGGAMALQMRYRIMTTARRHSRERQD